MSWSMHRSSLFTICSAPVSALLAAGDAGYFASGRVT